jgi:hypothetical protein
MSILSFRLCSPARSNVDDHLAVGGRFAEGAEPYFRVLFLPGAKWRVAVGVGLGAGHSLFWVMGSNHHLMFQAGQPGGHSLPYHSGSVYAESHTYLLSVFAFSLEASLVKVMVPCYVIELVSRSLSGRRSTVLEIVSAIKSRASLTFTPPSTTTLIRNSSAPIVAIGAGRYEGGRDNCPRRRLLRVG